MKYMFRSRNLILLYFVLASFQYLLFAQTKDTLNKKHPRVLFDKQLMKKNREAMKSGLSGLKGYSREEIDSMMAERKRRHKNRKPSKPIQNNRSQHNKKDETFFGHERMNDNFIRIDGDGRTIALEGCV